MNKILKKHLLAALCVAPLALGINVAQADEAAPAVAAAAPAAPASDWSWTANLGLYSQYMFRGVSLADGPALQGGLDLAHSSGFYAGTWWSNIDSKYYNGNKLETDWYVGYAKTFDNGLGINVLGNYYFYPDAKLAYGSNKKQSSFESSIALSYKWLTYTYFRVLTDYYGGVTTDGTNNSKGGQYNELKVNYKLPGDLNFMAKVGYQDVPDLALSPNEGDYAIGLNKDFSLPTGSGKAIDGFNAGGYFTNTFAVKNKDYYLTETGRVTNEATMWFYIKRTW